MVLVCSLPQIPGINLLGFFCTELKSRIDVKLIARRRDATPHKNIFFFNRCKFDLLPTPTPSPPLSEQIFHSSGLSDADDGGAKKGGEAMRALIG